MRTLMKVLKNIFGNNTKISASDIAIKDGKGKAETLDTLLKGKILYDDSNGTTTDFKLKDSAVNYEYIEIFYGYGMDGNFGNNSVKICYKYQKSVNLILAVYDGRHAQQMMTTLDINEKDISFRQKGLVDIITDDTYTTSYIKIYLIVGYK